MSEELRDAVPMSQDRLTDIAERLPHSSAGPFVKIAAEDLLAEVLRLKAENQKLRRVVNDLMKLT